MTALICTANKHGLAIAADSATTVSNGRNGKVYNTANKIFALSKYRPVGIMICGNAELKGIPWDIIIKGFRQQLKNKSFDELPQYTQHFIDYLKSGNLPFSQNTNAQSVIDFTHQEWSLFLQTFVPAGTPNGTNVNIPANILAAKLQEILQTDEGESICQPYFNTFRSLIDPDCSKMFQSDNAAQDLQIKQLFEQYAYKMYLRKGHSELVLVGYGEKEIYPSLQSVRIYSALNEVWKEKILPVSKISDSQQATIHSFAQNEDMVTMIEGIHPRLYANMMQSITATMNTFKQDVMNTLNDNDLKDKIQKMDLGNYVNRIQQESMMHKNNIYIGPLIQNIGVLEKEDLAALAENLISITSLRKKVTMEQESVGGPIDVAVISKYDGFIWLKRKHYFDAAENPQFRENYYRE